MVVTSGLRAYQLLALLVIAQLCVTAHAAEHGTGQHSHEDVVCQYGMTNDNDDVVVSPPLVLPQAVTDVRTIRPATSVGVLANYEVLLPPATGPPIFS